MSWLFRLTGRAGWRSVWTTGSLAAAVLVSGCGTLTTQMSEDPFLSSHHTPRDGAEAYSTTSGSSTSQPRPAQAAPRKSPVQTVAYESDAAADTTASGDYRITRIAAEERQVLSCPVEDCEPGAAEAAACLPCLGDPGGYAADEYLCDGGDRGYPVHYDRGAIAGLHTEDTVAEFTDSHGKRRVLPTNKVCVYSPRFAAVTAVTEPNENVKSDFLISNRARTVGHDVDARLAVIDHRQSHGTDRLVMRKRGSELYIPVTREEVQTQLRHVTHENTLAAHNEYTYVRTGILLKEEEAVLATSIQNAITLTRNEFPIIQGHGVGLGEVKSEFRANELIGKDEPGRPGRLRITKLADRHEAQPGDVVTFTIRFDNLGDLALTEVSIIDNLTPRLAYVPDSATLDLPGELIVEDNGEGSLILRWKLEQPLPGHAGGVATFQAKVR